MFGVSLTITGAHRKHILVSSGLGITYFLLARVGLYLATLHYSSSPVWPASGIAVAGLLLFGRKHWLGIFIGAFAANLLAHSHPLVCLGIAIGNTGEAILGAIALDYIFRRRVRLGEAREAVAYVAAAIGPAAFSAFAGVLTLALAGKLGQVPWATVWATWWTGDVLGIIVTNAYHSRAANRAPRRSNSALVGGAARMGFRGLHHGGLCFLAAHAHRFSFYDISGADGAGRSLRIARYENICNGPFGIRRARHFKGPRAFSIRLIKSKSNLPSTFYRGRGRNLSFSRETRVEKGLASAGGHPARRLEHGRFGNLLFRTHGERPRPRAFCSSSAPS